MSGTDYSNTYASTSSSGAYTVIISRDCSATAAAGNYTVTAGGTFTISWTPPPPPRKILVHLPKKWSKKTALAWAELINHKTKTGWIAGMLIFGEVIICDPNIDQRTLAEFLPLLHWWASDADKRTIAAFVKKHKA